MRDTDMSCEILKFEFVVKAETCFLLFSEIREDGVGDLLNRGEDSSDLEFHQEF